MINTKIDLDTIVLDAGSHSDPSDGRRLPAVGRLIAARCTDDAPLDLIERAIERVNEPGTQARRELA